MYKYNLEKNLVHFIKNHLKMIFNGKRLKQCFTNRY